MSEQKGCLWELGIWLEELRDQLKPRQPRLLQFSRLFSPLTCKNQQTALIQQSLMLSIASLGISWWKPRCYISLFQLDLLGQSPLSCHIMTSVFWLFSFLPDVVSFLPLIPWSITKVIYHTGGKQCPKEFVCCSLLVSLQCPLLFFFFYLNNKILCFYLDACLGVKPYFLGCLQLYTGEKNSNRIKETVWSAKLGA